MTFDTNVIEAFNENAQKYFERFKKDHQYHGWYLELGSHIENGSRVLDLGCGPGLLINHLIKQKPDCQFLGIDMSEQMIALAKKHVASTQLNAQLSAEFRVMNAMDINDISGYFDVICNAFLIPYLPPKDSFQIIEHSCKKLKPNGLLFLTWIVHPSLEKEKSVSSDGQHSLTIYYHPIETIQKLLERYGLKTLFMNQQVEPTSQKTEVCLIAQN